MTCDERRDLLLLYVSDALEADEAAEMRSHLQGGCPACSGHLAEAQAVMASLPLGLDAAVPPANLKARLMQRIDAAAAPTSSMRIARDDDQGDSLPIRLFRYLVPAAVAAGLAIVLTHFVMNQKLQAVQRQAETAIADKQASLLEEAVQLRQQMESKYASETQVVAMLQSPEVKLVHLDKTKFQPNASANLLWDQKRQQWALLTSGMTPAAPGQTYELWFVTDKGAVAAGVFDVANDGSGSLEVAIPQGIGPLTMAAVTNEKAGGDSSPHGDFQVLAKLN
jgi:hypothetical protein